MAIAHDRPTIAPISSLLSRTAKTPGTVSVALSTNVYRSVAPRILNGLL